MNAEDLKKSLEEYQSQLTLITEALKSQENNSERDSLLSLQGDLQQLVQLTQESLDTLQAQEGSKKVGKSGNTESNGVVDDEYARFMAEMAASGAYDDADALKPGCSKDGASSPKDDSDIEDELSTLLGMKCAVYHTHTWGGQPSLHNAMVSSVVPRNDDDQFKDLQVRVLYTHPTHTEMLPCPFFLDGECKFSDEQCRYSHGDIVYLSDLKEAIEPNFEGIKVGSRVILKIQPPDDEEITLTKKSSEKYHLWHRAVVKSVDIEKQVCMVKFEHGVRTGDKRKIGTEEVHVKFENLFPLDNDTAMSDSDDSISDTEYPDSKTSKIQEDDVRSLIIEKSLQNSGPAMGEWEKHTRGIGSKLMFAMGYVAGSGLGATGDGRVQPVEARVLPTGKSLDHCMQISEKAAGQDPLKVEQRLKRLQKKEEERNKRAYEREKEKERKNVFNFINKTLGDKPEEEIPTANTNFKQSTSKDLNIEQFKIMEETKRVERDLVKLNSSLQRQAPGTNGHRSINQQILEKTRELNLLKSQEQKITKEQNHRKDKQKMTVF